MYKDKWAYTQPMGPKSVEAMPSKVILMMPKNQELSKVSRFNIQDLKNQESRLKISRIKIKIQDSRFENAEKTQSR